MTGPRYRDAGADAFESALLSSAKNDRMSPARKRALALALGGSAAAGGVQLATLPAGTSAATPTVAGTAASKVTAALILKVLGGALAATVLIGGAGLGAAYVMAAPAPRAATVAASDPPAPAPIIAAAPTTAEPTTASVTSLPDAPTSAQDTPPPARSATAHPPAAARPGLAEEVRLVEQARSALRAGDVGAARAALEEHGRQFPRGALSDEVAVLRIDILERSGDRAGAERAARAYLAAHPTSPHAPRLRDFLGGGP
jgi:hypothetical protein